MLVKFVNGDVREECDDGTCTYFFKETKTVACLPSFTVHIHPFEMTSTYVTHLMVSTVKNHIASYDALARKSQISTRKHNTV